MYYLKQHIHQIAQICQENQVKQLFAVGSVTVSDSDLKSGNYVDLMVVIEERDPLSYVEIYRMLKLNFEKVLHRPVNLLEARRIKNPYLKKRIESSKVYLYGEKSRVV